jgi:hypothetical protein
MTTNKYTYVKVPGEQKRFFCLQQNPLRLAWLLFFEKNTLLPRATQSNSLTKWSWRWIKNKLWRYYYYFKANATKILKFLQYKFYLLDSVPSVSLPFYGQVCVLVNKGYKIFDLHREVAIKVYRDDVDASTITAEIERLKKGSLFSFGPSMRKIDITGRFYEEDYMGGSLDYSARPRNSNDLMEKFSNDVAPCLRSLMLHESAQKIDTLEYIQKMLSTLKIDNLLEERLDIADIDKVLSFMHLMKERLQSDGNRHVYLVLTHGDFCPANMLNTKEGLKILDWESAAYRSALFDFYSYFFFRPLHQEYPLEELVPELMAGLTFFLSKLTLMPSEVLANVKRYEKANRWLFYVERIYMLVERVKYDTKLDVAGNILRYIDVFNKYEELLTDKRIDSHGRAHGTKIYTLRADNKHIRPRLKTRSSA